MQLHNNTHTGVPLNDLNSFNNFDIQRTLNLENDGRNIETWSNITFNFFLNSFSTVVSKTRNGVTA